MITILTVDDSRTIRAMLFAALSPEFNVIQAESGIDALNLLEFYSVDLIITDIHMPEMGGIDFIRALRSDMSLQSLPILVLTTEEEVPFKNEAKSAGATGWVVKPFSDEILLMAVKRALDL